MSKNRKRKISDRNIRDAGYSAFNQPETRAFMLELKALYEKYNLFVSPTSGMIDPCFHDPLRVIHFTDHEREYFEQRTYVMFEP